MKNIFKIIPLLLLAITFGCDDNEENRFRSDPSTGFIEYYTAATTTGQTQPSISVPVAIRVPEYNNGLSFTYSIQAVEGDFTQFVSSTGGTVIMDPSVQSSADGDSRAASVDLDLANMEVGRDFVTSFDIILTAVDVNGVTLGGVTNILSHRVTIPCSNPDVLLPDYFVGDYAIADVTAQIGPGNGTENIATGVVTLSVDPFNPNVRLFEIVILPAFTGGALVPASLEFSVDDVVTLGGFSGGNISCNGVAEYGYGPAAAEDSGPWDICNDQSITINYSEDPLVACGGPYPASFSLTKI